MCITSVISKLVWPEIWVKLLSKVHFKLDKANLRFKKVLNCYQVIKKQINFFFIPRLKEQALQNSPDGSGNTLPYILRVFETLKV